MKTEFEEKVWGILEKIPDPEIPTISLVDLGVIEKVNVDQSIEIELLPTFSGCPALDFMKEMIENDLKPLGLPVSVKINRLVTWTSDRITPSGREKLKASGFGPPGLLQIDDDFELKDGLECPNCGSKQTKLDTMFGPTQCRAIYYCNNCHQSFEQFKKI